MGAVADSWNGLYPCEVSYLFLDRSAEEAVAAVGSFGRSQVFWTGDQAMGMNRSSHLPISSSYFEDYLESWCDSVASYPSTGTASYAWTVDSESLGGQGSELDGIRVHLLVSPQSVTPDQGIMCPGRGIWNEGLECDFFVSDRRAHRGKRNDRLIADRFAAEP